MPEILGHSAAEIDAAKKDAIGRMTHFETMMTTIPTVELGILAFIAKEFINIKEGSPGPSLSREDEILWFVIIVAICSLTTAVHLHWVKIHLACVNYVLDLEASSDTNITFFTKNTLRMADHPRLGRFSSMFGGIRGSWLLSSCYSLFVLLGAMLFFGIHLHIPWQFPAALIVLLAAMAGFYVLPDFLDFFDRLNQLKSSAS